MQRIVRTMLSLDVCQSVRQMPVLCQNREIFSLSDSHTILVFLLWQYSDQDALTEASNAGGMKKSQFSTNISLRLRNDTRSYIQTECEQQTVLSNATILNDLE